MRVLSICAGVGGIDLGLRLAVPTSRTVCYVEREAYAAAVLAARMEDGALDRAPVVLDLQGFDGRPWNGEVDCIVGGFPCQPLSVAGRGKGYSDERWLWGDFARVIEEVQPRTVLLENVPGVLSAKGGPCICGWPHRCGWLHRHRSQQGLLLQSTGDRDGRARTGSTELDSLRTRRIPSSESPSDEAVGSRFSVGSSGSGCDGATAMSRAILETEASPGSTRSGANPSQQGSDPRVERQGAEGPRGLVCPSCGRPVDGPQAEPLRAIGRVLWDLAELGFDAEWGVFSAAASGAPHLRKRWFLLAAHPDRVGVWQQSESVERCGCAAEPVGDGAAEPLANPNRGRLEGKRQRELLNGERAALRDDAYRCSSDVANSEDGRPPHGQCSARRRPTLEPDGPGGAWWAAEPDFCRVAHGVAERVDRLRATGNGVVPQVAARAWSVLTERLCN